MIIAILGIGEAGGALACDLIAKEVQVRGWDPEPRNLPHELAFAASNPAATSSADIVLSVNWASVAIEVATEVAPVLQPNQLCVDLNTAAPQLKHDVATIIEKIGASFVAVIMECLEAAEALNMTEYACAQMLKIINDEPMINRFVNVSIKHAKRRVHDMEAVVEMLNSIGVSAFTSQAAVQRLKEIMEKTG